jgi:hypothetical protein
VHAETTAILARLEAAELATITHVANAVADAIQTIASTDAPSKS